MQNNQFNQQQPQQMNQVPEGQSKGLAIASLSLGIAGLVLGCCIPFVTGFLGIAGLVLGIIFMSKNKHLGKYTGKGMAIAGIICSVLGTIYGILSIILILFSVAMPAFIPQDMGSFY